MQKKFQIFVSSTFIDLQDERRAVIEAILDIGHVPVGMEAFHAGNEEQWEYIKKRIDESDYYVVLVAERYGSEKDGISYTEMEYDYAREKGVPVAAFLLSEDARNDWRTRKANFIDNAAKVNAFRKKCEGLMVRYWRDRGELDASCVKSLVKMFESFPRDGWVPAKDAMSPDVAQELARLSRENEELRNKLKVINENNDVDNVIEIISKETLPAEVGRYVSFLDIFICLIDGIVEGLTITKLMGGGVVVVNAEKLRDKIDQRLDASGKLIMKFFNFMVLHDIIFEDRLVVRGRDGRDEVRTSYRLTDFGKRVARCVKQRAASGQENHAALG